ncbi:MAG: DUF3592 domain-containing protein [Armatimonadota bacterium]|nr:DUF3592 domain-containing protein [Armatimonadota bacterium]
MEAILSGLFGLLIGLGGLWAGLTALRNRAILDRWKTTQGKVIERGTYQPSIATLSNKAYCYSPLVKYAYQVAAQDYVGDCIHPKRVQLPEHSTQDWAQKRAASFADNVLVHYNPEDPAESFLVQTPKAKLYLVIGASCFAVLVGMLFLVGLL